MSSIKDRLNRLVGGSAFSQDDSPPLDHWMATLEQDLHLHVHQEKDSFILFKEELLPVEDNAAFALLQQQGFESHQFSHLLGEAPDKGINLRRTVFFDLETTGLAGGTGTYAFLVGVGTIETNALRIRQFLLPDFNHEWLMLQHLARLFQGFVFTGTFNGKTFDLPLLGNRFVLNQMENILDEMVHIDVLHAARRIWGKILPACDLQTLEKHILGKKRTDDIPGNLIPHIYFEFVRNRKVWMIADVLEHNLQDIQNMILLTIHLAAISEQPHQFVSNPEELLMLAEYYYRQKFFNKVQDVLVPVLATQPNLPSGMHQRMQYLMAMALKRSGKRVDAVRHLWNIVNRQQFSPEAIIELAKYYEHVEKNFTLALQIVNQGVTHLEMVSRLGIASRQSRYLEDLRHRRHRLRQRVKRQNGGHSDEV